MNGNEPPNRYPEHESRLIRLESSVEEILRRLDRMQHLIDDGFRQVHHEFNELRKEVNAERRWLVGVLVTGILGMALSLLHLASKL